MGLLIDTGVAPPRESFDFWREAASHVLHPLRLRHRTGRPFWGRLWGYEVGAVKVLRIEAAQSAASRTPATIAAFDPELLELAVQMRGSCCVTQEHRVAVMRPGDISTYETSRPYTVQADAPFDRILLMIPKCLLRPHTERICKQTAVRISSEDGLAGLLVPFVRQVVSGLDRGSLRADDLSVGESLLDLVRGLYLERTHLADGSGYRSRTELLLRIKAFIEASLGDPQLTPERIAGASFVSVRYLHKLFEGEGTSVCEWIRGRRLDRCRRDLCDPLLGEETILTIATRWGLTDSAHFSRLFRAAYGSSPSEFRREHSPARPRRSGRAKPPPD